jgi:CheY-like chemotaxis protein
VTIRVLLVDDTDHVREMLSQMLSLDGFEVAGMAAGGAEAVELAETCAPDIVIMDYKMPGMDGITATRAIRERAPQLPVILYTAYVDADVERRAQEAGATMCIAKVEGLTSLERQISAICLELVER